MAGDRGRSLQLSLEGRHKADTALLSVGTKRDLAADLEMSPTTITNFFMGRKVARQQFLKICQKLKLKVHEVLESLEVKQSNIDLLVQKVRKQIRPQIQEKCGKMRVLDMVQPIELGKIYTHVNILEKITGRRGLEVSELMRDTDPEKFDRFCLGKVREKRIPGLEAIEKFSKLMILGKPGAGKTTFLKYLAIYYISSKSPASPVPLFITLKDFAEAEGQPDLLNYIKQSILSDVEQHTTPLLNAGKTLILLDGLDEVREAGNSRVLKQIRNFSQQFSKNQLVITCRIAAREYIFEQFTDVEIADFDNEQIADFSSKWFHSKNDPIKAKRFMEKLEEEPPIRELATNPLLLTLLCLVFEDTGSFIKNRAELYERGLEVLLRKWDATRDIEREQVYKQLLIKCKKDLLSYIAYTTFEAGNYFFKQREVTGYINRYIQNLPGASTDPEALKLDSVAVLKSIEAQHGILTERARRIYSFSHLTFHEYFTARKIKEGCNRDDESDPILQVLVSHLTDKRWREVFLLTVSIVDDAESLLRLMKAKIDSLLAKYDKLQLFLKWAYEKSRQSYISYKSEYIRAIYFELELDLESRRNIRRLRFLIEFDFALTGFSSRLSQSECLFSNKGIEIFDSVFNITAIENRQDILLTIYRGRIDEYEDLLSTDIQYECEDISSTDIQYEYEDILSTDIQYEVWCHLKFIPDEQLDEQLYTLFEKIPSNLGSEAMTQWCQVDGPTWLEDLRSLIINHRNIGHDWQFSNTQKDLLQKYYDANKLLVDCLHSDCYVSRAVREEIEETLLLPIAEIEKREQAKKVAPSS